MPANSRSSTLKRGLLSIASLSLLLCAAAPGSAAEPIKLHPENPHYFLFRGKPTVLITSGEHYGAVLNLDFDYVTYLDELAAHGLNQTRTFSGVYCEDAKAFKIKDNPLAPRPNKLICPWARSSTPGYGNGGAKFDLERWDPAYFDRLKDFIREAGKRDIVVELVLFCPFYRDSMWRLSPMNARNNVNGVGAVDRMEVYTLKHGKLQAAQDAFVRKVVEELKDFDNVYFEICNEPYFGGVTNEWQKHIADVIVEREAKLGVRHMLAQNIANKSKKITDPNPAVSLFNFHYATPPVTVALNYGLNKALGDDETGFDGPNDVTYRREGWDFIIAGGALYSNLDYSFTPDHEDGSAKPDAPGGGGETLRRQLRILKDFIESFDFLRMAPDDSVIRGGVPKGATARALIERGKQYAIYVNGAGVEELTLDLPAGAYRAEWVDTKTGKIDKSDRFEHKRGARRITAPQYAEDAALRIKRAR